MGQVIAELLAGDAGDAGYAGNAGNAGDAGYAGYAGDDGYAGYAGDAGCAGYEGYAGYAGDAGYAGYAGDAGYADHAGYAGDDGDDGDDGDFGDGRLGVWAGEDSSYWAAVCREVDHPGIVAVWRSDKYGLPCNGGRSMSPAEPGVVHVADGRGEICSGAYLHATYRPGGWKGCRFWLVACDGEIVTDKDKIGCTRRTIIAEVGRR